LRRFDHRPAAAHGLRPGHAPAATAAAVNGPAGRADAAARRGIRRDPPRARRLRGDWIMSTGPTGHDFLHVPLWAPSLPYDLPVGRLGLASRGQTGMTAEDYRYALERGINFFNWCGTPNALSEMIASLGSRRRDVLVCVQFEARTAADAEAELPRILQEL